MVGVCSQGFEDLPTSEHFDAWSEVARLHLCDRCPNRVLKVAQHHVAGGHLIANLLEGEFVFPALDRPSELFRKVNGLGMYLCLREVMLWDQLIKTKERGSVRSRRVLFSSTRGEPRRERISRNPVAGNAIA